MDGLVFPDRTPHTGILEYKMFTDQCGLYLMIRKLENWFYIITWILDDLKDYLDIRFEVIKDGLSTVQKGKLSPFSVMPHTDGVTELNVTIPSEGKIYLN